MQLKEVEETVKVLEDHLLKEKESLSKELEEAKIQLNNGASKYIDEITMLKKENKKLD